MAAGSSPRRLWIGVVAVLFATVVARGVAMQGLATAFGLDLESNDPVARGDGLLIGGGILAGSLAGILALFGILRSRASEAIGLARPSPRAWILWTLGGVALIAAFDLGARALGRPPVEPAWMDAYRTGPAALLWAALLVTSIFEELFVRGLMFRAVASTRLGDRGAVVITALLFTAVHMPEDAWRFADVFTSGLLLGAARMHTGSAWVGVPAHILGNARVLVLLKLASG